MGEKLVTIAVAIVGVATLAVLVSRNAQTGNVIKEAGKAFGGVLTAAMGPVMGGGAPGMNGFTPVL